MTAATSFPSLRHRLGESTYCSLHGSLRRRGQWTSGRRLRVVSDCAPRWRSREQCEWQLYEVGLYLDIGWVASLSRLGGRGVGSVDAPQRGRSDFTSGRRPRMWCDVRGLRAVALSSVGCGQLGCAALLLEGSGGMSGRRPRKAVPVDCAGRDGAVDVGAAAPRESLWRPDFCGNDDGGSDVGDAAMVAVVGSSPACPRYCLGLFVAVESKLRRRGPVVYDDWLQVARSAIFRGASRAWFCSSEFSVRVGAALSGRRSTCSR